MATRFGHAGSIAILVLGFLTAGPSFSDPPDPDHTNRNRVDPGTQHGSLAEVGAKLSNPLSNAWALFTEFDMNFSDGDDNLGDDKIGSAMLFQPILPLPLTDDWNLIVRPAIPVVWAAPRPDGLDRFDYDTGLGDTILPMLASPKLDHWLLAVGPTFTLPTSTKDALGRQQWAVGPAAVVGYKTKKWVLGVWPQYFLGVGSRGDQGDKADASNLNLLYFGWLILPNAWQVGFNPNVTYDNKASKGNRWNVPVGITVAKMTKLGGQPVKFQLGVEYSVVSQDDFGKRALIKLNIIPVISPLIKTPLFGGS